MVINLILFLENRKLFVGMNNEMRIKIVGCGPDLEVSFLLEISLKQFIALALEFGGLIMVIKFIIF